MNFICIFLLDLGIEEENVFWIMSFIFENLIPKEYYTNMIPLIADIKLIKYFL